MSRENKELFQTLFQPLLDQYALDQLDMNIECREEYLKTVGLEYNYKSNIINHRHIEKEQKQKLLKILNESYGSFKQRYNEELNEMKTSKLYFAKKKCLKKK
jgi:hypothetical protein